MHFVYILYSGKLNKYYIGETHDIDLRLEKHNSGFYDKKWTAKGKPWVLSFVINCQSKTIAVKIEAHIKRMKSSKYIRNLKQFPEMSQKLIKRYGMEA